MFRRLDECGAEVRFRFEDREIQACVGDSVAAALLGSGVASFRTTPVGQQGRGPYCLMGVCFDCLVEINGVPNQQACLTRVEAGMVVRRQQGARTHP